MCWGPALISTSTESQWSANSSHRVQPLIPGPWSSLSLSKSFRNRAGICDCDLSDGAAERFSSGVTQQMNKKTVDLSTWLSEATTDFGVFWKTTEPPPQKNLQYLKLWFCVLVNRLVSYFNPIYLYIYLYLPSSVLMSVASLSQGDSGT